MYTKMSYLFSIRQYIKRLSNFQRIIEDKWQTNIHPYTSAESRLKYKLDQLIKILVGISIPAASCGVFDLEKKYAYINLFSES
jgi:hypothetical protein